MNLESLKNLTNSLRNMILNYRDITLNQKKPEGVMIILHGYGASGENASHLGVALSSFLPDYKVIVPNAPFPYEYNDHPEVENGYQWFSLMDRNPEVMYPGCEKAAKILDQFIAEILGEFSLDYSQLILVGISQGTMLSLHWATSYGKNIKALLGFYGMLLKAEDLPVRINAKPEKICMIHGDMDEVVPIQFGMHSYRQLRQSGINCEFHPIHGMGHYIDEEALKLARKFLTSLTSQ